ncbi:hypothetical protein M413DRAFT_310869 [Hebeloma cylindrosporum]|uniref:Uncharacterized protein n=1 Tax=Hebeloma cylindrosporum TaxID=76867 RepID=A0A0C3CQD0_HEBCY|nr:hypothetical protein M413DRAFT_310869 [Hebeloma cylindrosporum h7]
MARTPFDPLDPDYGPQTVHSSDLFFINNPMNSQQNNNPSPSISTQLYPYHQQAFHHYTPPVHDGSRPLSYPRQSVYPSYVPNNPIPPPPLPPKPPPAVYPQIAPTAYAGPSRPHLTQPPPLPPPPPPPPQEVQNEEPIDDSNELAMVLALSQSESTERKKMEEQLLDQEEQDLARALAESMSMLPTGGLDTNPFVLPASQVASSSRTEASPKRPPDGLPAQDASHKLEFPADPTNPFADIRRHDQWHVPDKPQEDVPSIAESSSLKRFSFDGLSFPISEPTNETTENARSTSRPLSISSVSSLPYTLPDPPTRSNTLDAKDALPEYSQAGATQFTPQDAPVAGPSTIPTNVDVVHIAESMDTVLVFDDEAYARQLEAEEQELSRQYLEEKNRPPDMQGEQPLGEGLPQYPSSIPQQSSWQRIEMVPSRLIIPSQATPAVSGGASRPTPTQPQPPAFGGAQLRQHEFLPRPVSSMPEAGPSAMFYSSPGPRRQSDADTRSDASHQSSGHSSTGPQTAHPERLTRVHQIEQPPPQSSPERRPSYSSAGPQTAHPERSNHVRRIEQQPPHSNPERHPGYSTVPSPQADNRVPSTTHHLPSPAALNAHHFLDRELLLGVCTSFTCNFHNSLN